MKNTAFKCENILDTTESLDEIFKRQQALTPFWKGYDIVIPVSGSDRAITMTKHGDFAGFCEPDRYYWDQYTGQQLGKTTFGDLPFAEQFRSLIVPFHTGKIFGSLSRYILFTASLIGVLLSITGYTHLAFRYRQKKKSRQKKPSAGANDSAGAVCGPEEKESGMASTET